MPIRFAIARARGSAAVVAACLALIVAGWVITLERVSYEREEAVQEAEQRNSNLAAAFEQQISRSIQGLDQAVRFLRHEYLSDGAIELHGSATPGWIDPQILNYVALIDGRGRVIANSATKAVFDVSDRDYFKFHALEKKDVLRVGTPTVSRYTGLSSVQVTRGIRAADGRFLGVALVSVSPLYFTEMVSNINVGKDGLVQLVGLDGVARARRVGGSVSYGQDMSSSTLLSRAASSPSGSFIARGVLDGVARYQSYRVMADIPFVVSVGASVRETHAEPLARERNYYLGASVGTVLVLLFCAGLLLARSRQRHAVEQRRRADASYRATFDEAPIGITHTTLDGRFLRVNRKFCDMLGYPEAELIGRTFLGITHPEDRMPTVEARDRIIGADANAFPQVEKRNLRKDGSIMWAVVTVALVRDTQGNPDYFVAMVQDVTRRKAAEAALKSSEERFRRYFELGLIGMAITDPVKGIVEVNDKICEILGYPRDVLLRMDWARLTYPDDLALDIASFDRIMAGESDGYSLEKRFIRKDGRVVHTRIAVRCLRKADGSPDYFVALVDDLTEQKRAQERVLYQMHHDALTDLPNRALCYDRLSQALSQARRKQWDVGLLFLDLDRFKTVNDTLGHAIGDELLRQVSRRIQECVRDGDTVARVGGDEFAVVLSELAQPQDASLVAQKILQAMTAPLRVNGHELFVTASIGIATCPPDGVDADTLMKNADAAMHRAKELGRDNFQFYAAEMNARAMDKLLLESDLRRAVERDEFVLHFQPKAALAGGRIEGFEALLRWQRAGNGIVPPCEFIPLLEETGMIVAVGEWVIRAACAQIAAWREAGFEPVPVAINVSAKQFTHDLYKVVRAALQEHRVEARLLEVEITESDAMHDPDRAIAVLQRLRELGVRLSIDDFGTGYSSLGYLKRFPVHALKLDRSFVTGLPDEADDVSIARAVISMAHSLGLKVVAEGVETAAQRDFLARNACDQMQGYLLARPLPPAQCAAFLSPAAREAEPVAP